MLKKNLFRIAFFSQYYSKKLWFKIKHRAPSLKKLHVDSFPAVHFRPVDWLDFVLKFSSELMIVGLAMLVAGLNIFYFSFNSFEDQSLASAYINHHQELNQKVYFQNTSIITKISQNPFIAKAEADDFTGLDGQNLNGDGNFEPDVNNSNTAMITDGGILAPSPDSIKSMVVNVNKIVYTTVAGDSLKSIAAKYGISVNSIIWSNSLSSQDIKPGWSLIIPPVEGVAVIAGANDTLPDLAVRYNPLRYSTDKAARDNSAAKLLETIISYNGLDSAEDINPNDFLVIPGGILATAPTPATPKPTPVKPKPGSKPTIDNSINNVTSIGDGHDGETHTFPVGYCTYYVAKKMKITFGGNAKNWLANAKASGYVTGTEPAPYSAVVMTGNSSRSFRLYGHVAYVESVNDNGTITISEMNFYHFKQVDTRTISIHDPTIRGYIYR